MTDGRRAACVIGWPIGHSRSPLIHNYWIARYGLDADYRREAVAPDAFAGFIATLRQRGYVGANVTVPHKQAALALSQPDDRARAVGAANTLWYDGAVLRSTNTDVEGFLNNLDAEIPGWDRGLTTAVVLGAGGAARAVIYALLSRGVGRIHVVNRSPDRADALHQLFGDKVRPAPWSAMARSLREAGLLVNATTLGMTGQQPLDIDLRALTLAVAELVYDPLDTGLVQTARARGLRVADGLGMLLHQAVGGFAHWFGVRPEVTAELRALVLADLKKK